MHGGHGGAGAATGYGLLFPAGLAVGLLGLVARRSDLLAYGPIIGLLPGFGTDAIVSAADA